MPTSQCHDPYEFDCHGDVQSDGRCEMSDCRARHAFCELCKHWLDPELMVDSDEGPACQECIDKIMEGTCVGEQPAAAVVHHGLIHAGEEPAPSTYYGPSLGRLGPWHRGVAKSLCCAADRAGQFNSAGATFFDAGSAHAGTLTGMVPAASINTQQGAFRTFFVVPQRDGAQGSQGLGLAASNVAVRSRATRGVSLQWCIVSATCSPVDRAVAS